MSNCMCGGCDRCLKDQGLLTDAEIAEREDAAEYLRAQVTGLAALDRAKFSAGISDAIGCDEYCDALEEIEAAAVIADPVRILTAATKLRAILVDAYIDSHMATALALQLSQRTGEEAEWRKAA